MPLDADIALALQAIGGEAIPGGLTGEKLIAAARRIHREKSNQVTPPDRRAVVGSVEDLAVPGPGDDIPARIYRPLTSVTTPLPAMMWLHGGGWITGDLETGDTLARAACQTLGAIVVSVDYRLAPEHPWPAGLDDALTVLGWMSEHAAELHIDERRLVVGGDSAGGNLAAVVAQRDDRPHLAAQLLIYPAVDLDPDADFASRTENGSGYGLTLDDARVSYTIYPAGADVRDPRISPIYADDLRGLPPAVISLAEFDPLRDEGYAYADRLRQASVPVEIHDGLGLVHGCFDMVGTAPHAQKELDRVLADVTKLIQEPPNAASRQP